MENVKRLKFIRIIVCAAFLVGIFCSFELWFPIARTFPRVPLFFESPVFADCILTIILIVSLIAIIFFKKPQIFLIAAIASLILLIVFDQTRLQPWVYQFLLILAIVALTKDKIKTSQIIGLVQIIIAGLYFWSGIQKLNFTFLHETLPILLAPLQNLFPAIQLPVVFLGIGIAVLEIFIGGGLFFRKTRQLSVCLAVASHLMILILLMAKNYNGIVWIWNAALIFLVVISFWNNDFSSRRLIEKSASLKMTFAKSIAAASVLLPILSFFGFWDMYLSGALYSGNVEVAVIRIDTESLEKLPAAARQVVFQTKNGGENFLPLFEWSMTELNIPAYPEPRASKQVLREICRTTDNSNQVELITKQRPAILDGSSKVTRTRCFESVR